MFAVLGSLDGTGRFAVMVVAVFVVSIDTSVKVGITALDSEKGSSNCLNLYCLLLAWWFTFLILFFGFLVFFVLGVCEFENGDIVGLSG